MDTRNSAMVVGLYLAGVVTIVVVGLSYYAYERPEAIPSVVLDLEDGSRNTFQANRPDNHSGSAHYYHATLAKANQSLRELQSSLAVSRDALERQTHTINQKNTECQALKEELDQTFTLILNLLADESSDINATRESTRQAKSKLEAELAQLIESLKQSEVLGIEQEQQLTQLRADLKRTDLELAIAREQSELEVAALLAEKKVLETVATEVVAHSGAAAVPVLIDRLSDERVEVRRWAAKALGAIGSEAQEATTAIRRLLSDPDQTVREEAQRALAALDEPEID